jgi:YfiH family protein
VQHGFGTRHIPDWPGEYTHLKQVHSDTVVVADGPDGCLGRGDALVTSVPGRWVGIRTADCVPILIADAKHRTVGAVHAGWRGTVSGIARRAVREFKAAYGSRPEDLLVALGPSIGECCYNVGSDVSAQFEQLFPERADLTCIDLREANRRQLIAAGVPFENVDLGELCTACGRSEFHSYRRDKERAGRMVAAIRIADKL